MTTADSTTSNVLSNMDRMSETSLLLYRAIALNDLLFEAATHGDISDASLSGATDAINAILVSAKAHVDSFSSRDFKGEE